MAYKGIWMGCYSAHNWPDNLANRLSETGAKGVLSAHKETDIYQWLGSNSPGCFWFPVIIHMAITSGHINT